MHEYNSTLMLTVLRREYPEIATIIAERIKKALPEERLYEMDYISGIVDSFKNERNVTETNWTFGKALSSEIKITDNRELLVAVLLMFYQPEKLLQLTTEKTKFGILKHLSGIIGASAATLCIDVSNVIVVFKAYEEFRTEVYRLYEVIKIENKFFK